MSFFYYFKRQFQFSIHALLVAGDVKAHKHAIQSPRYRRAQIPFLLSLVMLFAGISAPLSASETSYSLFEAGQVRPMAISANGRKLFVVNTPDNRLEAYRITDKGLVHKGSVVVGLEPVAVAVRDDMVWVVNHVSDSISIIDADDLDDMYVRRTLLVGDEPRDIVFAGRDRRYAFITTAHRGQNAPFDPQLTTPGVGRADVWVFDATSLGHELGGSPANIINLFTDTPRALAVSADGKSVYAAGFKTGNRTTSLFEGNVTANGGTPGADTLVDTNGDGVPEPHHVNVEGNIQPLTGLIVKHDGTHWVDSLGRSWDDQVKFNLPDKDVFVIDATAKPPRQTASGVSYFTGVGTVLFNMAVNPVNGKIYVSNTEALNQNRFEGPGGGGSTVRGHFAESRITVIGATVLSRHLNKHIDYSTCCAALPNAENARSLAFPMEMAVSADGKQLYVTAFGSSKIGVFDTAKLENDSFVPDVSKQIPVSGGGPSGLILDEKRQRLYVLTRFDNSISVIDTKTKTEIDHISMHNPEPPSVILGRRFLYDAAHTSSHGDSACAGCHVFGDFDSLAWDLGNPDGSQVNNPGPLAINHEDFGLPVNPHFAPMKGPMTTQSLRGLANHGPMHWRGDRTGGNDAPSVQPDSGIYDEQAAFNAFNVAFAGLVGRHAVLPAVEMQAFTEFALQIMYPPNPIRNLDNSLTPVQQAGAAMFFDENFVVDTAFHCNGCHVVDRTANAEFGVAKPGFFGTDGRNTFAFQQQFFKIPQLRNLYQKVGMFGMANSGNFLADDPFNPDPFFGNPNQQQGAQIRGFGFFHDGSVDTTFRFHNILGFLPRPAGTVTPLDPGNPANLPITPEGMQLRRQLEQFILAFDSNFYPVVGQQITLRKYNQATAGTRLNLLLARANLNECELVARDKKDNGYFYIGNGFYKTNRAAKPPVSDNDLRKRATKRRGAVTYTCVPPGNGLRMALDRDEDGYLDGDELKAGSDPADPSSVPVN